MYIIDSLKNPAEVDVLKAVYGELFYFIGAIQSREERVDNLASRIRVPLEKREDSTNHAVELERDDRKQSEDHEQQLDKTLNLCDYYISVSNASKADVAGQVQRFFNLVHGNGVHTHPPMNMECTLRTQRAWGLLVYLDKLVQVFQIRTGI